MTDVFSWFTGANTQALGWTLVHFLWQGALFAVLLWLINVFTRSARLRYAGGVCTLALLAVCPLVTFYILRGPSDPAFQASAVKETLRAVEALQRTPMPLPLRTAVSISSIDWLNYLVSLWFLGVLVFAIRALGGWFLVERLRRKKSEPLQEALRDRCRALQEQLGISRAVRYFESRLVDSPAVMGWFRPIVLLPVTALTGLSPQQLEAVMVHELAHIKRLDCFVNLFQIAVETLLFYHPAVWWISRSIRIERENCCDDIAIAVCGDASAYAKALTMMETWRTAPALVIAANGGSLKSRISRLLGLQTITRSVPGGGLAAIGLFCAAGVLLAGGTFNRFSYTADLTAPSADIQQSTAPAEPAVAPAPPPPPVAPPSAARSEKRPRAGMNPPPPQTPSAPQPPAPPQPPTSGASYIESMQAAGLKNLTVDELIALKVQGVTPEYIRDIRAAGLNPTVRELISMKAIGVTPEYVRELAAAGLKPSLHELLSLKAMGVTPDYIHALQSAGFSNLSAHEYAGAKAQGITPEFIQKVRSHGFNNLTLRQLIRLKMADVF